MSAAAISALLVVRDEAANIERAVRGVRELVAEVVVVDTGSTDATAVLAKAEGARVLHSPWLGYGPTKNWGAGQCHHDWVLSLDADEVPDAKLSRVLEKFEVASGMIYGVRRVTNYCGHWVRYGAWRRDTVWRLYDRREAQWDERVVHERLVGQDGTRRQQLPGTLLHYSYPTRQAYLDKRERYLRLSVEALAAEGRTATWTKRHLSPLWRGVRTYLLMGGWRDGRAGWEIAQQDVAMVREKYRRLAATNAPAA